MPDPLPDNAWYAINQAEMGNEPQQLIRTKYAPRAGSTAFGPVQLTDTTARDYVKRKLVSPESAQYYQQTLAPMYQNFKKYGREPKKPGYDKKWDYGGTGGFQDADFAGYDKLTTEIMQDMWQQANGDPERFVQLWRGVSAQQDPRYFAEAMPFFRSQ